MWTRQPRAPGLAVRGFTLVELVVAITLLGILAMVTVPLLQLPMSAYVEATRRAVAALVKKLRAEPSPT